MDIFLTKTHRLQKASSNPLVWSNIYYFYDGWMRFLGFKKQDTIHSRYKADIDCEYLTRLFLAEIRKSYSFRVSKL